MVTWSTCSASLLKSMFTIVSAMPALQPEQVQKLYIQQWDPIPTEVIGSSILRLLYQERTTWRLRDGVGGTSVDGKTRPECHLSALCVQAWFPGHTWVTPCSKNSKQEAVATTKWQQVWFGTFPIRPIHSYIFEVCPYLQYINPILSNMKILPTTLGWFLMCIFYM